MKDIEFDTETNSLAKAEYEPDLALAPLNQGQIKIELKTHLEPINQELTELTRFLQGYRKQEHIIELPTRHDDERNLSRQSDFLQKILNFGQKKGVFNKLCHFISILR